MVTVVMDPARHGVDPSAGGDPNAGEESDPNVGSRTSVTWGDLAEGISPQGSQRWAGIKSC